MSSPTQSYKTVEELLKNFHQETIAFANEEIDALDMNKVLNYTKQALTARENRMVQEAVLEARLGMIEYYDQTSNNADMDWKGLFADNRAAIQYELAQLKDNQEKNNET